MQGSSLLNKIDLLNHIQHGIIVIDLDGTILYCNSACEELFGYTSEEIIGKSIKLLQEKAESATFYKLLDKCRREEKFKGRWRAKCKNGSQIWLDAQSSTLIDETNHKKYCVITINNIEPLETAKKDLEKSTALEKTIFETSTEAIFTADESGNILDFNRAAVRMFGYDKKEIIGKNLRTIIPSFNPKSLHVFIKRYYSKLEMKNTGEDIDTQGIRKDGSVFYISMSVSNVPWNSEQMFVGIIRDLTQKRELEKQMVDIANQERRRIGRELHDGLGQMLTGTRMVAESLARKLKANEIPGAGEVKEISNMIREADEQARAISRGLVEVHLVEKGLSNALENLAARIPKTFGINCIYTEEGEFEFDNHTLALHIYRIVQEAVTNAVRHADPENICIRLTKNETYLSVIIEDDGIGFESGKVPDGGSGIQIMKYRADLLGGTVNICRTDDDKTVVRVVIPIDLD
ncbi:PAS domain-containing sensor histidine kinase [Rhodohalobacter sulfatireducens]|uniref:PAS domain S-box protein n=1 Tax=Rhodohalobacter sulfatireducens TaxID=2911366 RepID=A0ABS9K8Y9_9BACT|nr:PAS domain S-box protein [Rhodohalobacter sulfatireducens]MCG2587311.1 PAS domain S-box protein [Rhodohalobacter sulfatireducens]